MDYPCCTCSETKLGCTDLWGLKVTINPVFYAEEYPLPCIGDIFASLAGGIKFSVIDLVQAYHQMKLQEDSRKYLIINTQKQLYQYHRLFLLYKVSTLNLVTCH